MFNHVMVGTNDIDESMRFYDAILGALDIAPGVKDSKVRCTYRGNDGVFMIKAPINSKPATNGNGSTIGFAAKDSAAVDVWHASGLANGGTPCEDPPGRRASGVYLTYLRDPAGNKLCAAHRMG
ncbi:MAG: VOC family protein [Alphaproteobacteria bacterium]|jgi:catechol 2,3-dioxygenase-like lactoylglutathione lyase family enzyme